MRRSNEAIRSAQPGRPPHLFVREAICAEQSMCTIRSFPEPQAERQGVAKAELLRRKRPAARIAHGDCQPIPIYWKRAVDSPYSIRTPHCLPYHTASRGRVTRPSPILHGDPGDPSLHATRHFKLPPPGRQTGRALLVRVWGRALGTSLASGTN